VIRILSSVLGSHALLEVIYVWLSEMVNFAELLPKLDTALKDCQSNEDPCTAIKVTRLSVFDRN
jgi:hypothetical protein